MSVTKQQALDYHFGTRPGKIEYHRQSHAAPSAISAWPTRLASL